MERDIPSSEKPVQQIIFDIQSVSLFKPLEVTLHADVLRPTEALISTNSFRLIIKNTSTREESSYPVEWGGGSHIHYVFTELNG